MEWLITLLVIIGIAGYFIAIYNRLIALRNNRENAFSDIDVQLKLRFNLVPQLVETVKGYVKHENETFENVTKARAGVSEAQGQGTEKRAKAEGLLGAAMLNLFAVAENYPDLKADTQFQKLMAELSDIENKIAAARRFFNSATNELNTALQQFPASLIAGPFGFSTQPFFEIDEALADEVAKAPEVKFG